ncbi:MAG TPA: permease [Euzebyales bacterium]|nr:permease [Euzebyales bacterium]
MSSSSATAAVGVAWLVVELVALFLVIAGGVELTARRLGLDRLRRLLGGTRLAGATKGVALGFLTPFCTYSAIPVLIAMLDAGVRTSAWTGFLLAAPVLDPLIAVALAVVFGPAVAIAYTAITGAGILAAALLADAAGIGARTGSRIRRGSVAPVGSSVDTSAGDVVGEPDRVTDRTPWRGWPAEAGHAAVHARHLLREMAVPLVIAAVVAVIITGVVPQDAVVAVAGPDSLVAVPAAALLGAPLYVSGEAFLPIAAALRHQGMGDGALVALIIAGSGVNLPELTILGRLLDRRVLAALVGAIVTIATIAGYLVPAVT